MQGEVGRPDEHGQKTGQTKCRQQCAIEMNVANLIIFVNVITTFFSWLIIASSILSFILPPYHPVREALGRILNPFLDPIRRSLPSAGGLDFSPLILYFAVQVVSFLLVNILNNMR